MPDTRVGFLPILLAILCWNWGWIDQQIAPAFATPEIIARNVVTSEIWVAPVVTPETKFVVIYYRLIISKREVLDWLTFTPPSIMAQAPLRQNLIFDTGCQSRNLVGFNARKR